METVQPQENTFILYRTYKEADDGYLMTDVFTFLVIVVAVYLAFVLKIGPYLMKGRPPFQLKNTLLIYNLFQVIFSLVIAVASLRPILKVGIIPSTTPLLNPELREMYAFAAQCFYLGKFTELLDTIFFVLRKKYDQISFLHVYHHSSVIIGTWMVSKYGMSHSGIWGAFMNAAVHVAMYFYYFLAALGPKYHKYLTWKRYMTTFQLVQFATVFIHQTLSLLITKGEHTIVGIGYTYFSSIVFISLFSHFYITTYNKKEDTNGNKNGHANIKKQ